MKDYRRILAIVLTVILSVCLFALPAMAATETANGLELTLVTDKAEYTADEQITATLTIKNTTDAPVTGLVVKHQIPEGIKTLSGDVEKLIPTLGAGESVTLEVALKADVTASTGDFAITAVAAALILSGAGLVFLSKDAKVRKGVISMFLCCAMIGGLVIAIPANAETDELTVTTTVKVAGKDVTLTASAKAMAEGTYSVVDIAELTNGTVTADKEIYTPGDTVTLTLAPDAGYFQKLYINGEPLMLDWKNNTSYTFTATETLYTITGSFERSLEMYAGDWGRWDNANHAHGVLTAYHPNNNDSWWTKIKGEYTSIAINARNLWTIENSYEGVANGGGWRVVLYMQLDNGKYYAFSMWIDAQKRYAYNHYGGNVEGVASSTGWSGAWRELAVVNAEATAALNGDGAEFKLNRIDGNHIQVTFGGTVLETYEIPGVTEANKVVGVGLQLNGNKGEYIDVPFELTVPGQQPPVVEPPVDENAVEVEIPTLANGTVTADKENYEIGDTVTLTIAPNSGYFQKLYINGKPVLLGWKTFVYSFVATENQYTITGSFERGAALAPKEWGRWDDHNQAHGILTTYYPNNTDSWWMDINGEYSSIAITAKNYLPKEDTMDNNGNPAGYQQILRIGLDNGNYYAFRLYNDKGTYAVSASAVSGSVSGWGNWKALDATAAAAVNGEGVTFKLERVGANTLEISVNGTVLITYTMSGVTEANKVTSVGIQQNCNQGQYVDIPFELG